MRRLLYLYEMFQRTRSFIRRCSSTNSNRFGHHSVVSFIRMHYFDLIDASSQQNGVSAKIYGSAVFGSHSGDYLPDHSALNYNIAHEFLLFPEIQDK